MLLMGNIMDNVYVQRAVTAIIGFFIVAVFVGAFIVVRPKILQAEDLAAERDRIRRRIDEKRAAIQEIKDKQNRFNTDREFVESLARQNRRVFPGELVFVFDD